MRQELREVADSTLRESLERERQRADEERARAETAETEARALREDLERAGAALRLAPLLLLLFSRQSRPGGLSVSSSRLGGMTCPQVSPSCCW
jgi:hypothetical protein